jgi:hypothetical protein
MGIQDLEHSEGRTDESMASIDRAVRKPAGATTVPRAANTLAKLSEGEGEGWRKLWNDVGALLRELEARRRSGKIPDRKSALTSEITKSCAPIAS